MPALPNSRYPPEPAGVLALRGRITRLLVHQRIAIRCLDTRGGFRDIEDRTAIDDARRRGAQAAVGGEPAAFDDEVAILMASSREVDGHVPLPIAAGLHRRRASGPVVEGPHQEDLLGLG